MAHRISDVPILASAIAVANIGNEAIADRKSA